MRGERIRRIRDEERETELDGSSKRHTDRQRERKRDRAKRKEWREYPVSPGRSPRWWKI